MKKIIRVFTPSWADENNTNAQNLTVKEIVSRLDPDRLHVTMFRQNNPDPRLERRPNTEFLQWAAHGNTFRVLTHLLMRPPDIYFYPRETFIEAGFLWLRRRFRLKSVLITHVVKSARFLHTLNQNNFSNRIFTSTIREAKAVFGNSYFVTRTIWEVFGVHAETIHNGIDNRFYYPRETSSKINKEKSLRILYAGSFQSRKRVQLIIRIASQFPNIAFRLAGKGEEINSCQGLAKKMGCRNVIFLGHLNPAELGEEMRRTDIFLFPSVAEGHPQVLGQAAACGLPCVAMDLYHPDYVIHGETGFLSHTDEDFIKYLERLINDSDLRSNMSNRAIQHARQFDWDISASRWASTFEEALESE